MCVVRVCVEKKRLSTMMHFVPLQERIPHHPHHHPTTMNVTYLYHTSCVPSSMPSAAIYESNCQKRAALQFSRCYKSHEHE